ncbi:MAG: biotin/lipoyl-binding protein [Bacteroidales bacterium]|jgi:biotin carboxyl carrier protein|nr:biotin/lipoyl-binding protein [Bacteroidales bacterium]
MKTYKFTINGNKYSVDVADIEDNKTTVELNGTPYEVTLDMPELAVSKPVKPVVKVATAPAPKAAPTPANVPQAAPAKSGGSTVKSPLPGVVLEIFVKVGDTVKAGQRIILLEAMKMENNLDADREGVVKDIRVQRGDAVMEGDVLLVIE